MAVNNKESTDKTREAAKYFSNFLERVQKESDGKLYVGEPEFGDKIKEAGNATALLMNPLFRDYASLSLGDKNIIPERKIIGHASTICCAYANGTRHFPRKDIQELGDICDVLIKCIEALEKTKKQFI